jgi:uncharacterized protein YndB with AHSA1/START domain
MADIVMDFLVKAGAERVFPAVSTGRGLETWWTKRSTGEPRGGAEFELDFGPNYLWRGKVTKCVSNKTFELQIGRAHEDWNDTRVGFELEDKDGTTTVHFHHTGWPSANEHWRVSVYCWAMYLRLMRRNVEHGELVPYEKRLDV